MNIQTLLSDNSKNAIKTLVGEFGDYSVDDVAEAGECGCDSIDADFEAAFAAGRVDELRSEIAAFLNDLSA